MSSSRKQGLPEERPFIKRLRHWRREWLWRQRLRFFSRYGLSDNPIHEDPAIPDFSVGAVAMGALYTDWCLTMVDSLRKQGGFQGPIYVLTDHPGSFAGLDNVKVIAVPQTKQRLLIQACKPVLMGYAKESRFLYLDSDLVVTAPIKDWYERMEPYLERSPVLCYPDEKPTPGAFHTGVILLDVARGKEIIERWEASIHDGRWGIDQACMYDIAREDGPGHLPEEGITFLSDLDQFDKPYGCLVHITHAVIKDYPIRRLAKFMSQELGIERLPSLDKS